MFCGLYCSRVRDALGMGFSISGSRSAAIGISVYHRVNIVLLRAGASISIAATQSAGNKILNHVNLCPIDFRLTIASVLIIFGIISSWVDTYDVIFAPIPNGLTDETIIDPLCNGQKYVLIFFLARVPKTWTW